MGRRFSGRKLEPGERLNRSKHRATNKPARGLRETNIAMMLVAVMVITSFFVVQEGQVQDFRHKEEARAITVGSLDIGRSHAQPGAQATSSGYQVPRLQSATKVTTKVKYDKDLENEIICI
jgi:hypothetical protein